jgi:hypothetical protein
MVVVLALIGIAMSAWLAYDSWTKPDRNGRDVFVALGSGYMAVAGLAGLLQPIIEILNGEP